MPELPEVETIIRDLKSIEGQKVIFNRLIDDTVFKTDFYKLDNLIIERIERYGKYIIIKFEKTALLIHLGMSGQLYLEEGDYLIPKHCHWLIQLENGWQIRYVDTRKFGNVWHMTYKGCRDYVERRLGPEIWDIDLNSFILTTRQNKYKNKMLKVLLLEQSYIAGIGNIYASEICYEAFLNPKVLIKNLTDKQIENLYYCIKRVLENAIKNKGTTISDYRTGNNNKGNNQSFLKAYKQEYCNRCRVDFENGSKINVIITKEKIKGRMTYYCDECQRMV